MVSSKTARIRKIFRKTPAKVYSNLNYQHFLNFFLLIDIYCSILFLLWRLNGISLLHIVTISLYHSQLLFSVVIFRFLFSFILFIYWPYSPLQSVPSTLYILAFLIFSLLLLFSSLLFSSLNFFLYIYSPSSVFSLLFLILTFSSSLSSYCLFFAFLVLAKRVSDRVGGTKRRFSPMSRPRRAGGCESRSGFIYIIILMCE